MQKGRNYGAGNNGRDVKEFIQQHQQQHQKKKKKKQKKKQKKKPWMDGWIDSVVPEKKMKSIGIGGMGMESDRGPPKGRVSFPIRPTENRRNKENS